MLDWGTIAGEVVTAAAAFAGVYTANKKQTALMAYRLEQLEKKVDKHNQVVERTFKLEQKVADMERSKS